MLEHIPVNIKRNTGTTALHRDEPQDILPHVLLAYRL